MATVSVSSINQQSCIASILNLQYTLNNYNLRFEFYSANYIAGINSEYLIFGPYDGETYDPTHIYSGLNFQFNQWFQPSKSYTFYGYAEYPKNSGTWILCGSTTFSTTDVSRPSASEYLPTYYPSIRSQNVYNASGYVGEAQCCIASALSTALDINEYRERGSVNNYYSTSYIYGNRDNQSSYNQELSGMVAELTIAQLISAGSPAWQRIPQNTAYKTYPDNRFLTYNYAGSGEAGASTIYNNASDVTKYAAHIQKISNYANYHFWDSQSVATTIQNKGYYVHNFSIPNNFYTVGSSGIVPAPNLYSGSNHTLLLIGWKTISGTKYWIGQNSWGTGWGDGGRCYIPMNWGATIDAPNANMNNFWAWWGQSVDNYVSPTPNIPGAPTFQATPRVDGGLNLTWTPSDYSDTYTLRYKHYDGIYHTVSGITTNSYSLTSLEYATIYYVSVRGDNYIGSSGYSGENPATTAPCIPSLTIVSNTSNSIDVSIGVSSGGYTKVTVWYRIGTGSWSGQQDITSPNTTATISGLTAGSTYELKASSFWNTIESIGFSSATLVLVGTTRPSNFVWTTNIASGNNVNSFNASTKTIYPVSASEWNSLLARINEFRVYKGLSEATYELRYSGDEFTKERFDQARYNLVGLNIYFTGGNTLLPARVSGDNCLDSQIFLNLTNCLNSIA